MNFIWKLIKNWLNQESFITGGVWVHVQPKGWPSSLWETQGILYFLYIAVDAVACFYVAWCQMHFLFLFSLYSVKYQLVTLQAEGACTGHFHRWFYNSKREYLFVFSFIYFLKNEKNIPRSTAPFKLIINVYWCVISSFLMSCELAFL